MRIKHFTAPTTTEAMSLVRAELGEEAIIISTETTSSGVRVTAAIENEENINFDNNNQLEVTPSLQVYDDVKIRESLEYHDVLMDISSHMLALARQKHSESGGDNQQLLTFVLKQTYKFKNLLTSGQKNKIFMGVPGCGKSTVIAKLATKAKFQKKKTAIISTDIVRAGANNQLKAFTKILETDFFCCKTSRELFSKVQECQSGYDLILIDTPGINPYVETEVAMIDELIDSLKADKILVADAGRNTFEAVETGGIFARLGAEFILPTHLDMTRRIGSFLSSAYCNKFGFCAGSVSSNIAKGLADMTPSALAKLILTE